MGVKTGHRSLKHHNRGEDWTSVTTQCNGREDGRDLSTSDRSHTFGDGLIKTIHWWHIVILRPSSAAKFLAWHWPWWLSFPDGKCLTVAHNSDITQAVNKNGTRGHQQITVTKPNGILAFGSFAGDVTAAQVSLLLTNAAVPKTTMLVSWDHRIMSAGSVIIHSRRKSISSTSSPAWGSPKPGSWLLVQSRRCLRSEGLREIAISWPWVAGRWPGLAPLWPYIPHWQNLWLVEISDEKILCFRPTPNFQLKTAS